MLTIEELQNLMSELESDRIERTTSTTNTDKFAQAICAFSNDFPNHRSPGYLLIGVNDDGSPSRLKVTDRLLQNLAALRSAGNIQPLPALTVQKYTTLARNGNPPAEFYFDPTYVQVTIRQAI